MAKPAADTNGMQVFNKPGDEPAWAVRYGSEFWRGTSNVQPIDVAGAVERVKHAFAADRNPLDVTGRTFAAELDGRGFRFHPFLPAGNGTPARSQEGAALQLQTASIRAGEKLLYQATNAPIPWSINGNVAQGLLSSENQIVEHLEVRQDGVSVTWVFNQKPDASSEVEVRWRPEGLRLGAVNASGHHFFDGNGKSRVRVGQATAVDAHGVRTPLQTVSRQGHLVIQIPQSVIENSGYPLAIDPVVSAEFELDNPVYVQEPGHYANPTVTSNGIDMLVTWTDARAGGDAPINILQGDIYALVLANDGDPKTTTPQAICVAGISESSRVAVNSAGDWLVVWDNDRPGDVFAALVKANGTIATQEDGVALSTNSSAKDGISIGSAGTGWLVAWKDYRTEGGDIYGVTVDALGVPQQLDGILIGAFEESGQEFPTVGASSAGYYVAWYDYRGTDMDLYGTTVSTTGVVGNTEGSPIVSQTNIQFSLSLASIGTDWLIVWADRRLGNSNGDIYGRIIDSAGNLGSEFALDTRAASQTTPVASSNGSNYFVIWQSGNADLFGSLVSPTGVVADANGIPICDQTGAQTSPDITREGTGWMATWQDRRSGNFDIYAATISAAGAVVQEDGFAVSSSTGDQVSPRIASYGSGTYIVWVDAIDISTAIDTVSVFGALVSTVGAVTPPDGRRLRYSENLEESLVTAAAANNWFSAWVDDRNAATTGLDIYGMLIDQNGTPISTNGILLCDLAGDQTIPAVASNGTEFLVAWSRGADAGHAVAGTVIDTNGAVQQADGVEIIAKKPNSIQISGNSGNNWLVVDLDSFGDLWGRIMTPTGTFTDLSAQLAEVSARGVQVSGGDNQWLVVWDQTDVVHGTLVAADGLCSTRFDIASGAGRNMFDTQLVALPNGWFAAWTELVDVDNSDLYGAKIKHDGTVLTTDIVISDEEGNQDSLALTATPTGDILAIWRDRLEDANGDIYGSFIDVNGVVQRLNGFEIATGTESQSDPIAETDGTWFLAAWQEGNQIASAHVLPSEIVTDVSLTDENATLRGISYTNGQFLVSMEGSDVAGREAFAGLSRAAGQTVEFLTKQNVTFDDIPDQELPSAPIQLNATSDSGLSAFTYCVISGPGTITGNELTVTGAGEIVVRATEAGNGTYEPGAAQQTVVISKLSHTITLGAIANQNFSRTPFSVSATSSRSLPITYSIVSGPATISGNRITMQGLGSVSVRASNAGNSTTEAATSTRSFVIVDTIAPSLSGSSSVKSKKTKTKVRVGASDNYTVAEVTYRIQPPGGRFGRTQRERISGTAAVKSFNLSIPTKDVGTYKVEVTAVDAAGVKSRKKVVTIKRE